MALEHDPMCGHCYTAWDLLYGRIRSNTTIRQWLEYCRWGGCDPDVWDFLDDNGEPTGEVPTYNRNLYHRRADDTPSGWRFSNKKKAVATVPRKPAEDIEWDTEEEDIEWE